MGRKVGKMKITEKDVDTLLDTRRKLSQDDWDFINRVICTTINARTRSELTDSEIDGISKHLKSFI